MIRVVTTFDEARATRENEARGAETGDRQSEEEDALERFVISAGQTDVPVEIRYIRGNTGFAAADFVQSVEADLLAVPVPLPASGESELPANFAWLTDVIPCNLWVSSAVNEMTNPRRPSQCPNDERVWVSSIPSSLDIGHSSFYMPPGPLFTRSARHICW